MPYLTYPYPSQRMTTISRNGMVATSQPLAAQAGLTILKKGGNAIDAAIATAACLTVVEPTSNGIGGDAFALVWTNNHLYGLNGSGPAPKDISIQRVQQMGHRKMPTHGWIPITVPGAPSAWVELNNRFGILPLKDVLKPAIDYARNGYPISPVLGDNWRQAFEYYKEHLTGVEFQEWFKIFAPKNRPPYIGEMWNSDNHAETLTEIAETNGKSFYKGRLAKKIAAASKEYGGFLCLEDLNRYKAEWVEPISVKYRGYEIWEIPPNGQGLVALMTLNILNQCKITHREDANTIHYQLEAMKQAFTDGKAYITDPAIMKAKVADLLSEKYGQDCYDNIQPTAQIPKQTTLPKGGTVYLATADGDGNMVSFIQSNYKGFGSGIVIPGTGIAMQNRGSDFSLDPGHENALAPGKRTYHTIIPGFITKDNHAVGPFGVMGAYMQPQGHVQVVMNLIDFKLNPQAALDAPRWQWLGDKKIAVEYTFPNSLIKQLAAKGHEMQILYDSGSFGRGQVIIRDSNTGVLMGGTEARADGAIACW
ncbi:gamma-glutamyltransferase [Bacillus aquiflavi]|uniref:Glutathione hydrolase proenzyme n=1 Tax=Bacillus aquiflavi TaxID=2672567 RepID=A0A6B3VS04_9BACI|nr:gamma-glutamyltransferase [Bacillus aquiflavi]MBA4536662.1 gamma-glutamyltransferase [Bacillus aquiflavi]NEY81030.1 gamma-glutamyltransferase [Bacillus aquiflavi]